MTTHCDFCLELSGSRNCSFARIYNGSPNSRTLFRSDKFVVIPSLGQIVEGYLLIVPTGHFKALGDLGRPELEELSILCEKSHRALNDSYGSHIFFEHGTRREGHGGCGIYHAHLHATPLAGVEDPIRALTQSFPYTELATLDEIIPQTAGLLSYLFYQDSRSRLYLFDTGPLPSQYMRKLLGEALGNPNWDWRAAGREDRLLATIDRLSKHFDCMRESPYARSR